MPGTSTGGGALRGRAVAGGDGVLIVYACVIAITTAEGAVNLLYAPYLQAYGYSLPAIGALSSLFALFRLGARVPVGATYRPARARRQLAMALGLFTAGTSGFAVAHGNVVAVVLLTVVHGFAFGSLGTLTLAVVIDLTGGRRAGVVMGWYTAALSIGYALGAFAGGGLADAAGAPLALGVLGALPTAAALALVALPPVQGPPHPAGAGKGLGGLLAAAAALDARVWLAFTIGVYLNLLSDSVDTFFPLFGLSIGLPLAATGVLKGLKSGSAAVIRFVSAVLFRYLDHRSINVWAVILSGAATAVLPWGSTFGALAALFVLAGLTRGILRVTSAATVAELRSEGREVGLASGIYNAGLDVGAIVGPPLGGLLGRALSLPAMFQVVGVGCVAAYFAVALATRAGRSALRWRLRAPAVDRPPAG